MNKEKLEKIVRESVENIWYNRRSINPISEQTKELTNKIWNELTKVPSPPEPNTQSKRS